MSIKIEKKEIFYAVIGVAFIMVWFLFLKDYIAKYLSNITPFFASFIYNIGFFIGLFLISNVLHKTKTKIFFSIVVFIVFIGMDIMIAPYIVDIQGNISTGSDMWYVSSDGGFASLYKLFFPVNIMIFGRSIIWYLTYIFTPFMLVFLLPIVIANPKIIKNALH